MDLQLLGNAPPRDMLRCQIICVLIDYTQKNKLWITTFAFVDDWNTLQSTCEKNCFKCVKSISTAITPNEQDMKKHLKKTNLVPHPHPVTYCFK